MGEILDNNSNIENLGLYAYHNNTEFFCIDENGYVYMNGATRNGDEDGGVIIENSYIDNSTLNNISITDKVKISNIF